MKKFTLIVSLFLCMLTTISHATGLGSFSIRSLDNKEFYTFVKVFSEMRGPLRVQILKDSKTNFEEADPLKYLSGVKDDKEVQEVLKKNGLRWDEFIEIFGNVLLGYFSVQPEQTKASLIRQLYGYGLELSGKDIPPEYKPIIEQTLKTKEGAQMANIALDLFLQIPSENSDLARKNEKQLNQMFYTRFWKDKI